MSTYGCVTLNCILFIDLYLTLSNPFYPRKKRVIYYYLFTFVVVVLIFYTTTYSLIN